MPNCVTLSKTIYHNMGTAVHAESTEEFVTIKLE